MSIAIVTGSSGLIGSESVRFLCQKGMDVIGIDNDMRAYFFGPSASTQLNRSRLQAEFPRFTPHNIDVRDTHSIRAIFNDLKGSISLVIHTAGQPSHDWATREPMTDFTVNANGTLTLLEAVRTYSPDAAFIFTSTNKVYGDTPNTLPYIEQTTRFEIDPSHRYSRGIDESMTIDQSMHSLFGCSKLAADILVQEYGRYFGMKTGVFRTGCITGPDHSGTELHGFLHYLAKCIVEKRPYTIYGHKGKQVRDNLLAIDLVKAFWCFFKDPKPSVYNLGGSGVSNCSLLEAISLGENLTGRQLEFTITDEPRAGDHKWWVSDVTHFQTNYPMWKITHSLEDILKEILRPYKQL